MCFYDSISTFVAFLMHHINLHIFLSMCQGFVCPPVIETSLEFLDGSPRQELHKYIYKVLLDNNLRSFWFIKYLVVPQNWFDIFMIFL
jgi:hypothetical protein